MIRLRRVLLVATVWLTTFTSFVAGIPHFDCVCPDGTRKPFCLGFQFDGSCCFQDGCSSPLEATAPSTKPGPRSSPETKPACCACCSRQKSTTLANGLLPPGPGMQRSSCHRTRVEAEPCLRPTTPPDAKILTATVSSTVLEQLPLLTSLRCPGQDTCHDPPPPDLVFTLGRLVI